MAYCGYGINNQRRKGRSRYVKRIDIFFVAKKKKFTQLLSFIRFQVNIIFPAIFFVIFALLCFVPFMSQSTPQDVLLGFLIILSGIPMYILFVMQRDKLPWVRNVSSKSISLNFSYKLHLFLCCQNFLVLTNRIIVFVSRFLQSFLRKIVSQCTRRREISVIMIINEVLPRT